MDLHEMVICDYRKEHGVGEYKVLPEYFFNLWGSGVGFNQDLFEFMLIYHLQINQSLMPPEEIEESLSRRGRLK